MDRRERALDAGDRRVLDEARPDWVIHCAAIANLEECEANPSLARQINGNLPGELAAACCDRGLPLIHISTDAVFDGTKDTPYTEDDATNPISIYARTKLEGEQAVQAACCGRPKASSIPSAERYPRLSASMKRRMSSTEWSAAMSSRRVGVSMP